MKQQAVEKESGGRWQAVVGALSKDRGPDALLLAAGLSLPASRGKGPALVIPSVPAILPSRGLAHRLSPLDRG